MVNRMSKGMKIIVGTVVAAVVLVVVAVAVLVLTRDEAPEAVDLGTAVAQIEAAEATDDSTDTPSVAASDDDSTDVDNNSNTTDDDAPDTDTGETPTYGDAAATSTDGHRRRDGIG